MTKVLTDEVFTKHSLFYSREIPTKSMEIHDIPLNQEKALDELFWLRYTLLKIGDDTLRIVISSVNDPHFLYEVVLDPVSYKQLQKKQTIHINFEQFCERVATMLDYCLLHLHECCDIKSRFCSILNEDKNNSDKQMLHICE